MAAVCSKCKSKNVNCSWTGDTDGACWTWITWTHECRDCGNIESREIQSAYDYEDIHECALLHSPEVCVKVDCNCPHSSDWPRYPKDIIGLHRIDADDPKAKLDAAWTDSATCCDGLRHQKCNNEKCWPQGKIVEIFPSYCGMYSGNGCYYRNMLVCPIHSESRKPAWRKR